MDERCKIHYQSVFDKWEIADNSIQTVMCSPPYWSLRKYNIPDIIIGGNKDCNHEWSEFSHKLPNSSGGQNSIKQLSNAGTHFTDYHKREIQSGFCIHCNAWKGQYGLEPSPSMFVEHTLLWCQEVWRVLKDGGIFFLNIGDSYNGSGSGGGGNSKGNESGDVWFNNRPSSTAKELPPKCLCDIPFRVSIALVDNQGWIKRNNIVWYSTNKMPESVQDRFSKKHEMIFMLVKNERYYFNLTAVREEIIYKDDNRGRFSKHGLNANPDKETYNVHPNGKNPGDVWSIPTQPSTEKHYAMWGESLVRRMIECSTKVNDIVLDPFVGSGRTLDVACGLGRKAIGIDLGYKELSEKRMIEANRRLF